jgi:CRISPR-associated protein Cas2
MFVIVCYDITDDGRLNRARKVLRKYLNWVQYSVFEGNISYGNLEKCLAEVSEVIDKREDSLYVYMTDFEKSIRKKVIGKDKNPSDNFI